MFVFACRQRRRPIFHTLRCIGDPALPDGALRERTWPGTAQMLISWIASPCEVDIRIIEPIHLAVFLFLWSRLNDRVDRANGRFLLPPISAGPRIVRFQLDTSLRSSIQIIGFLLGVAARCDNSVLQYTVDAQVLRSATGCTFEQDCERSRS